MTNKTPPPKFITDSVGTPMRVGDRLWLMLHDQPGPARYTLLKIDVQAPGHWLGHFRPHRQRALVVLSESDFIVHQVGW